MSGKPSRSGPGDATRAIALWCIRIVTRQARVKWLARAALERFPALQTRLYGLLHRNDLPPRRAHVPQDVLDLSPDTQAMYLELKRHFAARKR
jgi:hypothetical protein